MKFDRSTLLTFGGLGLAGVAVGTVLLISRPSADMSVWHGMYVDNGMDQTLARKWTKVQESPPLTSWVDCQKWAFAIRENKVKSKDEPEDAFVCARGCTTSWIDNLTGHGDEKICAETHAGSFQHRGQEQNDPLTGPLDEVK